MFLLFHMYKGRLADMAKRIDHSDVVLMVEVVAVVFGDFIGEVVWVETKGLFVFVIGLDGFDFLVSSEDLEFLCMWDQTLRPLCL